MFTNKTLLITGGTGSFGQAVLDRFLGTEIGEIRIFSRDEKKQDDMRKHYRNERIKFYLGNVRDISSVRNAMHGVDYIFHAAALKQVPSCEFFPLEAVKTNVIGTDNVLTAAIDYGVKKVICLSTDKAAIPINLYGATKLCSDKLFTAANNIRGHRDIRFTVVRYGNVMGSRGSVIPFFLERRKTGVLPITDPRMTRFWITLEQGVGFVLESLNRMVGGELFVPKLPSMNMMNLAKAIAPECRTEMIGIRPGEKLHEVMIPRDEARRTIEYDRYYIIQPDFRYWERRFNENGGEPVEEDFEYQSGTNPWQLSIEEMRKVIQNI